MPMLYVVATPIGNLEDITLRALRILREVKLIIAEDTRTTRHLLQTYSIKTPVTSYHEHNKKAKLAYLLDFLGQQNAALVSEAGMPGVSDPGYELIVAAIERGIAVVPIPGASAVIAALAVSGLLADQFLYLGFLPRNKGERKRLLQSLAEERRTMVAFEAPHRLLAALGDILSTLGDRGIAICRELTKVYEEVFRGKVSQAIEHFSQPRGEFTLVIAGSPREELISPSEVEDYLRKLKGQGKLAREGVAAAAQASGLSKRELYRLWLKL